MTRHALPWSSAALAVDFSTHRYPTQLRPRHLSTDPTGRDGAAKVIRPAREGGRAAGVGGASAPAAPDSAAVAHPACATAAPLLEAGIFAPRPATTHVAWGTPR